MTTVAERIPRLIDTHAAPAALTLLSLWLGYHFGGFHARHWTIAALIIVVWAAYEALRGRLPALRSPGGVALLAGAGLTAWSAVSITWSQYSRHLAWDETNRTLMYVAAFALGSALFPSSNSLARYAAWAAAGTAGVGLATVARMQMGEQPLLMFVSGRLDGPLGYSNALAALYVIGAWLLIGWGCSADRRQATAHLPAQPDYRYEHDLVTSGILTAATPPRRPLRTDAFIGALTMAGTWLLLSLAFLGQSRGAMLAGIFALILAYMLFPARLALTARLAIPAILLAASAGRLGSVYTTLGNAARSAATQSPDATRATELALATTRHAATIIIVGMLVAAVCGAILTALAGLIGRRVKPGTAGIAHAVAVIVIALLAGIALAGVAARGSGNPTNWVRTQYAACVHPATAGADAGGRAASGAAATSSHFGDVGTNRCDFWRVAINNFRAHPVQGIGANNFQGTYVLDRRSGEEPLQAHSLPLQILGELGIVGVSLFGLIVLIVLQAGARFGMSGPARDPAFAGAVVAIGYWFAHAGVDWLWNMPATTLPVVVLAGALVACVSRGHELRTTTAAAIPLAIGALILATASLAPQGMADRLLRSSRDPQRITTSLRDAQADAAMASRWDPTWAAPVLQDGALLARMTQPAATTAATAAAARAREAVRREPANWSVRVQAAKLVRPTNPALALRYTTAAQRLNPRYLPPKEGTAKETAAE